MLLVELYHRSMSMMKLVFTDDSGQQNQQRVGLGRLVALTI